MDKYILSRTSNSACPALWQIKDAVSGCEVWSPFFFRLLRLGDPARSERSQPVYPTHGTHASQLSVASGERTALLCFSHSQHSFRDPAVVNLMQDFSASEEPMCRARADAPPAFFIVIIIILFQFFSYFSSTCLLFLCILLSHPLSLAVYWLCSRSAVGKPRREWTAHIGEHVPLLICPLNWQRAEPRGGRYQLCYTRGPSGENKLVSSACTPASLPVWTDSDGELVSGLAWKHTLTHSDAVSLKGEGQFDYLQVCLLTISYAFYAYYILYMHM